MTETESRGNDKLKETISILINQAIESKVAAGNDVGANEESQSSLDTASAKILEQILEKDADSAQQNLTRLRASSAFFNSGHYPMMVGVTRALTEPIEEMCNRIFHRSGLLSQLKLATNVHNMEKQRREPLACITAFLNLFVGR